MKRCENCRAELTGRQVRFCRPACRSAHWRASHPEAGYKPLGGVQNGARRPSRNGRGTSIYLTPEQTQELDSMLRAEPASPRLQRKVREAKARLAR